jgi:hypothetical protein
MLSSSKAIPSCTGLPFDFELQAESKSAAAATVNNRYFFITLLFFKVIQENNTAMPFQVVYYLFTKQKKGYKKSNPHQRQGL